MSKAYCPLENFLVDFKWPDLLANSNEFKINENISIITNADKTDFSEANIYKLSPEEIHKDVNYWIKVTAECDYCGLTNYIHLFQLSLLIVKPTAVKIYYKYNKESLIKFENIFKFVEESTDNINKNDLTYLSQIYPIILNIFNNIKRLRSALVSMLNGSVIIHWNAAYVLYLTSFEALLTHTSNWGKKKKLSWAYALLIETEELKRQLAYGSFRSIYKIRSEILHGESFKDKYNNGELNLNELAKCRDMLRKLWQVILDSPEIIGKLSGSDGVRRKYFKKVANGWMPEEENEKGK